MSTRQTQVDHWLTVSCHCDMFAIMVLRVELLSSQSLPWSTLPPPTTTTSWRHRRRHRRRHQKLSTSSTWRSWWRSGRSRCSTTPRTKNRLEFRKSIWCTILTGDGYDLSTMSHSLSTRPNHQRLSRRCLIHFLAVPGLLFDNLLLTARTFPISHNR